MQHDSREHKTAWTQDVSTLPAERLDRNLQVDVCVVGAGIAGLTIAYVLTARGRTVAVLDDGPVGDGETGRTTAHLSHVLDDRYFELERLHGVDGARLAADSHTRPSPPSKPSSGRNRLRATSNVFRLPVPRLGGRPGPPGA